MLVKMAMAMIENERIAELLTRLKRNPTDAGMEELVEIYAGEATTESERASIRKAASTTTSLMFGLESWSRGVSEADPERLVRLRVAVISMTDGWPDSRDAFLAARGLIEFAGAHGERCTGPLNRLVGLSTPRVQHLFSSPTLNMTLWR
jgi:hypothetical protein